MKRIIITTTILFQFDNGGFRDVMLIRINLWATELLLCRQCVLWGPALCTPHKSMSTKSWSRPLIRRLSLDRHHRIKTDFHLHRFGVTYLSVSSVSNVVSEIWKATSDCERNDVWCGNESWRASSHVTIGCAQETQRGVVIGSHVVFALFILSVPWKVLASLQLSQVGSQA